MAINVFLLDHVINRFSNSILHDLTLMKNSHTLCQLNTTLKNSHCTNKVHRTEITCDIWWKRRIISWNVGPDTYAVKTYALLSNVYEVFSSVLLHWLSYTGCWQSLLVMYWILCLGCCFYFQPPPKDVFVHGLCFSNNGLNMLPWASFTCYTKDNQQGCFRLSNWISLRRLGPWMNHLPPAW